MNDPDVLFISAPAGTPPIAPVSRSWWQSFVDILNQQTKAATPDLSPLVKKGTAAVGRFTEKAVTHAAAGLADEVKAILAGVNWQAVGIYFALFILFLMGVWGLLSAVKGE